MGAIRSECSDIGDRALEKVSEHANDMRRSMNDERPGLLEIEVAHRIDYVAVWRGHQSFGVHPVFPDRQYIVALAKLSLRAVAHADGVQGRQGKPVRLDGVIVEAILVQLLDGCLVRPAAVVHLFHEW
ncbi:hypothetical protein D9M71_455270 [compost metagenome]